MIRLLREEDILRVGEIWFAGSLQAHPFISPQFWQAALADMQNKYIPQADGYVHETNGRIDGFVLWQGDFLHCLFVDIKCQGKGIGTALINQLMRDARELRLKVYQKNTKAIDFYDKHGFRIVRELICEHTGCAELLLEWKQTTNRF